jgi:hypothetical protein
VSTILPVVSGNDRELSKSRLGADSLSGLEISELVPGGPLNATDMEVLECLLMSGSALGPELNNPEEDEAWKDFNPGT